MAVAVALAAEPEADAEEAELEPLAVDEMHWVPSGVSRVGPPSQTSCEAPGVTVGVTVPATVSVTGSEPVTRTVRVTGRGTRTSRP